MIFQENLLGQIVVNKSHVMPMCHSLEINVLIVGRYI